MPEERTPNLRSIRYTAIVSVIMATRQHVETDFYWMNLTSRKHLANGIFRLERLNPTIGVPGDDLPELHHAHSQSSSASLPTE